MDKKRILIISRAFYPDISPRSFRATELAKEFARQGHEVVVLTIRDEMHHEWFEKEHHVQIKTFGRLALPEINFTNGGKISLLVKRLFRRLLLVLLQYPEIEIMFKVKSAIKYERSYDLLVSIAVPHPIHWGVAWGFHRNANAPTAKAWIADCGDPFMGVSYDRFGKMFYFKYLEKWFCRKTDFITVPVEEARDAYYPEFRKKIRVIPQGFKFEEYEQDRSIYVPNEVPTFAYAGALMKGIRDPRVLLNYLVSQTRDFKFYIYTKTPTMVSPFLEAAQGRLILKDYLPREELLKELSRMDFLVNINNITAQQVPSKLIDYYFTGRPVLSLESGGIDPAVINQFLEGDYRAQFKYEQIERFRIENVCKKFLTLCR
jgi:hypothetical protein